MAARRKKRPLRPRVPARVKKRTKRPALTARERAARSRAARARARPRGHPLPRPRRRRRRLLARRRPHGDHRQRRLRAAGRVRRARRTPARAQRPPRRPPVPAGVGVSFLGLMTLLGKDSGGLVGMAIGGTLAALIGQTGRGDHRRRPARRRPPARDGRLDGRDPASHGPRGEARRLGRTPGVRVAVERDRRPRRTWTSWSASPQRPRRPSTACSTERRRIPTSSARPRDSEEAALLVDDEPEPDVRERRVRLRDVGRALRVPAARPHAAARLAGERRGEERHEREDGGPPRPHALRVRRRGDRQRPDLRPARHALRAAARPGTKVSKVAGAQGRPLLCARDDGDPHPRADPGQAGRRRRGPEPLAEARHARRHLRRPAREREPAVGLARQGHLRQRGLDRPRAHAAPAHRRHDRIGQVGLHQHDPHLDAPPLDAGRGADDPHRPEAHRARLLRVDPASPDAGRLEPEGGGGRAHERRRRDGAPLRAALLRPRAQPAGGEPGAPRDGERRRCRTCSSSSTSSPT